MLTPEDRQRIEAEEQYRAEVRARMEPRLTVPPKSSNMPVILGVIVMMIIGAVVWSSISTRAKANNDGGAAPSAFSAAPVVKTRFVPVKDEIASGQIIVKSSNAVQYRFTITPEMIEPTVSGNFNASGGSGNDITAVIADEMNYMNWINGHQARVFWGTQGQQTTGAFEVRLAPGTYYLVFSNKFSAFTDKQVFLKADLNYKKAETYY